MQIIHRYTSKVLYESTSDTIKEAVIAAVASGVNLGGAYLRDADLRAANLYGANLGGAYLYGANLSGANLRDADLRDADLSDADLSDADLSGADLRGADLSDADLSGANLRGAKLGGADLRGANLSGANLRGAKLGGADLRGANLGDADLEAIKQDLIAEVLRLPNELESLRSAIVGGKIDGSTYSGACACLAGTLARAHGEVNYDGETDIQCNGFSFRASSDSPRERWFLAIMPGDTPETNPVAKLALEWVDEAIAIRDNIRATAKGGA